jgi:hypothetical protein
MMDSSPLPWGEGGESSEPGEGLLRTNPRNFGIQVYFVPTIPGNQCAAFA